jgi:hypothetical protein
MTSDAEKLQAFAESVAQERVHVDETVKEIRHKLTPGQLIDEVLRQGGEPVRNAFAGLGKTVARHPVPMLLIGAGLVWLALERQTTDSNRPTDEPPKTS